MNGTSNLERTFWIDRIIPSFQIFGDPTGLLSYKWCEVFSHKYVEISADIANYKPGNAQYMDGMGYDKHNEERLVMEYSGGPIKENIHHTSDNTLKQIHISLAF